jgi:Cof subfamily protein (haloacid dehalogenase superfamily)
MINNLHPGNIKALALDLDGTILAPGPVLTKRTAQVLRACGDKGLHIIFATGRAPAAAEKFREPLGAGGPMVYFNGAVVADMPGARILSVTPLQKEAVEFCIDLSRKMNVYYQIYFPGTGGDPRQILMAERDSPHRKMYRNHTGILAELGDLKEVIAGPAFTGCIKSMFLAEPPVQDRIRPKLEERFGGSIYVARTFPTFLEVMNASVSKGRGLSLALEYRGIKPEETAAFGDEENDLPMFALAAFSAAPANAKEPVKAAADMVVGPNTEDGIAAFLEKTFLQ